MADLFDTLEEPAASTDLFDEVLPDERERRGRELAAQMASVRSEVAPKLARVFDYTVQAPGKFMRFLDSPFPETSALPEPGDSILPPLSGSPYGPLSEQDKLAIRTMEDKAALEKHMYEVGHPVRTGIRRGAEGLVEGAIKPSSLMLGAASLVAPEVAAPLWLTAASQQVHDAVEKISEARKEGDREKYWEGVTELGGASAIALPTGHATAAPLLRRSPIPFNQSLPLSTRETIRSIIEAPDAVLEQEAAPAAGKEPSALQERTTEEVLRDVPSQPRQGEGQVPAEESAGGVPQRDLPEEAARGPEVPLSGEALASLKAEGDVPEGFGVKTFALEGENPASTEARADLYRTGAPFGLDLVKQGGFELRDKAPELAKLEDLNPTSAAQWAALNDARKGGPSAMRDWVDEAFKARREQRKAMADFEDAKTDAAKEDAINRAQTASNQFLNEGLQAVGNWGKEFGVDAKTVAEARRLSAEFSKGAEALTETAKEVTQGEKETQGTQARVLTPAREPVTPSAEPAPEPALASVGPGAASPEEFGPSSPFTTSLKNAITEQKRAVRGMPPVVEEAIRGHEKVWADVLKAVDENPRAAEDLIAKLKSTPRPVVTDFENFLLLHQQVFLEDQLNRVTRLMLDAAETGGETAIPEYRLQRARISDELQELYDLDKVVGREQARAFGARRRLANEQFTLARMTAERRAANDGKPLTPEQEADIQKTLDEIAVAGDRQAALPKTASPAAKLKAAADVERPKQKWRQSINKDADRTRPVSARLLDLLTKWRQAFVISGLRSLIKLASATVEGLALLPARELVGGVIGELPVLRKVAAKAPGEGGVSVRTEAKAIAETWRNLLSDFEKNLKGQKPDYEVVYGKFENLPPELQNYVGYLHGALKSPLGRNVWTRSFNKRLEFAAHKGVDITDPGVQMELGRQAWEDSQFWRFQNPNLATKAYRGALSIIEKAAQKAGTPLTGKAATTALKLELPVVTVPSNIVARVFEGIFGTLSGSARVGLALRRGLENLSPAQADLIMRNFKTGSLGLGIALIGFFNPQMFGGYYQPGRKRDRRDVSVGGFKAGDVDIPSFLVHNPLLEAAQFGATMRRVMDGRMRKRDKDTNGLWLGAYGAVAGATEQQPFVREGVELAKGLDPRNASRFVGEHARSYAIPMLVQNIAEWFDRDKNGNVIVRNPRTVGEYLATGIPGLRETVPARKP